MSNLRDIKRNARRDLHEAMSIPALFLATVDDPGTPITVRIHSKWDALGMQGAENGLASRRELKPKILFMRSELAAAEIEIKRNAIVSVEPGEAYRLDNADAPDDISVTFFVTVLSATEAAGLPFPVADNG